MMTEFLNSLAEGLAKEINSRFVICRQGYHEPEQIENPEEKLKEVILTYLTHDNKNSHD